MIQVLTEYGEECLTVFDDFLRRLHARAKGVSIFLVYDRPDRTFERPGLEKTYFIERCLSDQQLDSIMSSLREIGCYVELFSSEVDLAEALVTGKHKRIGKPIQLVYNGIEGGIGDGAGFGPGRKAMIPALCDAFEINCANSNAYTCALGRHKYHYTQILRSHGLPVPEMWHYEYRTGWTLGLRPPSGNKVIAKSTYESWSVGVTDQSVFIVDDSLDNRVREISEQIGQSVSVQIFESGAEICAPVIKASSHVLAPPVVGTVLKRRPNDPDAVMTIDDNLNAGGVTHYRYNAPEHICRKAAELSAKCCSALGISGLGRVDMRLDNDANLFAFDVGVSPGITVNGSSAAAFMGLGYSYQDFVRIVFAANLANHSLI